MSLDLDFVRSRFPALAGDWTFFDNAGGSQILAPVIRRIVDYLETSNVQLGASYAVSALAGERVAAGAAAIGTILGAPSPAGVVLGPSTTALLRILSQSVGETLAPGDEIVVTNCDHEANIGPWRDLERRGAVIREWRLNPDSLALEAADLAALLGERTRLVAFTHASNVIGAITPAAEFTRLAHAAGALVCVDGVAYAPHRRVDAAALDADFYLCSAYKVYGPHLAALVGKPELLRELPGINHFFIVPGDIPYKFQPGGPNYELGHGLLGLADYLAELASAHGAGGDGLAAQADLAFALFAEHEERLVARLLDFLASKPAVRVVGPKTADRARRVPTVSFVVAGKRSDAITLAVDAHRIGIRHGDFYARRLIDALDLSAQGGVVRVSMVHYNTLAEVDRLVAALDPLM